MATAVVIAGVGSWVSPGQHKTVWSAVTLNTTGDVGQPQNSYGGLNIMAISITGTLASTGVFAFENRMATSDAWTTAVTVTGAALTFDSTTGSNLSTGTVYHVRPGALQYRPHMTAGASGTDSVTVTFVQSKI